MSDLTTAVIMLSVFFAPMLLGGIWLVRQSGTVAVTIGCSMLAPIAALTVKCVLSALGVHF